MEQIASNKYAAVQLVPLKFSRSHIYSTHSLTHLRLKLSKSHISSPQPGNTANNSL